MNQQLPPWLLASILVSAFSLAACNSSSGGGGAQNDDQDDPPNGTDTEIAFSGKVADGYIVGATVCLDINRNALCDTDEPSTVSSGGGNYTLEFDESLTDQHPVLVEVGTSAYDEDTGESFDGPFTLSAPAGSGGFVSPLTTLVAGRMGMNPDMTKEEAEAAVLEAMGFGSGTEVSLFEDYIERGDEADYQVQHKVAQGLTRLFVAAEIKGTELESSGELGEYSAAQKQQVIADLVGESLADMAAAAIESDSTDEVVESWLAQIDGVDSEMVATLVARTELTAASSSIDLAGFIESEQENSFFFRDDYLATYTSESITGADGSELEFTDEYYDENVGDFVQGTPGNITLLISDSGELVRSESFNDQVHITDDYPEMDGAQRVSYIPDGSGTLHRIDEKLDQGKAVAVAGGNLWQTLAAVHPSDMIQPVHKSLFDPDVTLGSDAKAVLVERRPIGDPVWTINYHTDCSEQRLVEIGEVDEPYLSENCSIVWFQGLDWGDMVSNTLDDAFNSTAYIPDADPVQNYENLDEDVSSHVMVEMGEHRGRPFTEFDGIGYGTLMAEIVGSPSDESGDVNWYLKQYPLTRYIESDTDCQDWTDLWERVNGNCSLPDYLEIPVDGNNELYVPSDFSDLIVESPFINEGEKVASQLLNNYGKYQAIFEVGEYRDSEIYDGLEGIEEYTVYLAGELLGAEEDTEGDLALYQVTQADTVGFSRWECGSEDDRSSIDAINGNCALASGFDYSVPFSLADQMVPVAATIDDWTASSIFDGTPFYQAGILTKPVMGDESCEGVPSTQPFNGVMIGDPSQESGTFVVFERARFEQDGCTETVRELASLVWTRSVDVAGNIYFEIDINDLLNDGLIDNYHGDWDNLNPGYIYFAIDGEILRPAQLRTHDSVAERLAELGSWEKSVVEGRETISVDVPDALKTDDWRSINSSLVVDEGIVRWWRLDEQGQIESLNVSSEWQLHTLGDEQVVEITRPDILGLHFWGHGITDVGTRIRRVQSHLRRYENENQSFLKRTWYSRDVVDQIQSQVRANYATWATEQAD